jgi:hypothetical protein
LYRGRGNGKRRIVMADISQSDERGFTIETTRGGVYELMDCYGRLIKSYEIKGDKEYIRVNMPAGKYAIREKESGEVKKLFLE